jgi:hypothetical protein
MNMKRPAISAAAAEMVMEGHEIARSRGKGGLVIIA